MKQVSDNQKTPEIRIRITVILKRADGKVCFVRHRKKDKVYWLLPGGGQEPLESALEAAKRELIEELNLPVENFCLAFVRESFDSEAGRHIQFLVFEGLEADFSRIATGVDERVEGFDFFDASEVAEKPIYPAMKDDLIRFMKNERVESFRTLEWIP
ncbi:MAG: NUDIX domain-containing protein [Candidatus Rifleibacteriota bacterium]